jgi:hypothetical protein
METNPSADRRMFIMGFNSYDEVIWSTLFGTLDYNQGLGIDATPDKLFATGIASLNYTLLEHSITISTDYYQPFPPAGGASAVITRFDLVQLVSVSEDTVDSLLGFSVYPNPATDVLTLHLLQPASGDVTVQIVDATGRLMIEQRMNPGSATTSIDISTLANGAYFIQVIDEMSTMCERFIKTD